MGPGCAVKAVLGRHFSLTVFGFSQVAMDLEPLVRMLRHDVIVHGFSHTYLGATGIGVLSLFIGRPVCRQLLLLIQRRTGGESFFDWLFRSPAISWPAAISGAFIGTYSHVFLDSIMHADMQPYAPFSNSNGLLGMISFENLHLLCVVLGLVGLAGLVVRYAKQRV
jgi:hypothetical protein